MEQRRGQGGPASSKPRNHPKLCRGDHLTACGLASSRALIIITPKGRQLLAEFERHQVRAP